MNKRPQKDKASIRHPEPPKEKLDFESMRAITSKMKLYPGSFVEDMRAADEL